MKVKMPYGLRKYLRREKARIRKAIREPAEQKRQIEALCEKLRR